MIAVLFVSFPHPQPFAAIFGHNIFSCSYKLCMNYSAVIIPFYTCQKHSSWMCKNVTKEYFDRKHYSSCMCGNHVSGTTYMRTCFIPLGRFDTLTIQLEHTVHTLSSLPKGMLLSLIECTMNLQDLTMYPCTT